MANVKITTVRQAVTVTVCSTAIFHIIAIMFGAPIFESGRETFLFAVVLTGTAVLPACCILGLDFQRWIRVFVLTSGWTGMERAVYATSVCSVVGAWLGAVPIPLDWDRPWQVWPISCVVGTVAGFGVGLTFTALHHLYTNLRKRKIT